MVQHGAILTSGVFKISVKRGDRGAVGVEGGGGGGWTLPRKSFSQK